MFGAVPPTIRPTANRAKPVSIGGPSGPRSESVPATTMPIRLVSMNALNTHPYSRRSPKWRLTTGRTVAMASASKATNVTASTRPTVRGRRSGAQTPPARPGRRPSRGVKPAGAHSSEGTTSTALEVKCISSRALANCLVMHASNSGSAWPGSATRHLAVASFPERRPELELLQLPGGRPGQRASELDGARALEMGHTSAGKLEELLLGDRGPIAEDHQCFHTFAPLRVGHTYNGNFSHSRVLVQAVLDFDGRDVFAAGDDDVFLAVSDGHVPQFVDLTAVARLEPTVLDGLSCLLRLCPITPENMVGPGQDFSSLGSPDADAQRRAPPPGTGDGSVPRGRGRPIRAEPGLPSVGAPSRSARISG